MERWKIEETEGAKSELSNIIGECARHAEFGLLKDWLNPDLPLPPLSIEKVASIVNFVPNLLTTDYNDYEHDGHDNNNDDNNHDDNDDNDDDNISNDGCGVGGQI
uniref:Uncharacterized protein n=1 Tax=Glossina morsitans morsitans TaxID=37546 RepID=A0A1B0G5Q9_GLOMM